MNKSIACIIVLFFGPCFAFAQKSANTINAYASYKTAYELFVNEKYAAAQKQFLAFIQQNPERELNINAQYYAGVCAMELFNADAIALLTNLNQQYPEHPKAKLAIFQLGKYFYRNKDNKRAIVYFEQVDALSLTPEETDEYYFSKGYCYFKLDDFANSKKAFWNLKDKKNKYFDPTNYYLGYILYKEGNFEEALNHFNRIKQSKTFGPLAQVYIAQILFSKKQYQDVVSFADSISNKDVADDVAGIVGQSYFNLNNFEKAIPYLSRFNSNPPVALTNQDIYRLGYAYFATHEFEKAIEQFTRITEKADTTAQYAHYHLAECYLKTDKKRAARLAFDRAYKAGYNNALTELALFNYAKLGYELNQPEALKDFVKFINDYPESEYIDEARGELSELLTNTRNYKEAIKVLEIIKKPTQKTNEVYQRVNYYYAEQLYLNSSYKEANECFIKSQQFDFDKKLYALAYFWQAEIAYKNNQFAESVKLLELFIQHKTAVDQTRFYPMAFYNLGYGNIRLSNYSASVNQFTTFLETPYAQSNPDLYTDAALRIADCYFVDKAYQKAIDNYNLIISKKMNGSDYALYQNAMIYGVLGKNSDKVRCLNQLISDFKKSPYIDDAYFEMANVHLQTDNYADAIKGFNQIITDFPRSAHIRKAIQYKGLAERNAGKDEAALETFKKLALEHCNTEEAKQALVIVEDIYISKGETDQYLEFLKATQCKVISATYQDSISFDAAFNQYKNGDCIKAAKLFGQYINRFAGGYFILKANYYKAECEFKLKNFDEALVNYEYVANAIRNDFTERATRQTAYLYFTKKLYRPAFAYYSTLERIASGRENLQIAVGGLMKSTMLGFNIDTAATYSFKYINSGLTTKEGLLDAHLNVGRYYMSTQQFDSAQLSWQYLVKETKNIYAAEAKYNLAYMAYVKKDFASAKKTIFEISEKYANYATWYEKAFILLADVYHAQKDYFQAKATLQSLIDNLDDGTHKTLATEKLKTIIAEEELTMPKAKPAPEKEIEKIN